MGAERVPVGAGWALVPEWPPVVVKVDASAGLAAGLLLLRK